MPTREALQRIKAATVAIARWQGETNKRHPFSIVGSGFCIDPCGIVVTARHVVDAFMGKPTLEQIKTPTGQKTSDGGEILPPVHQEEICAVFYSPLPKNHLAVRLAGVTHVLCKTDHDLALLRLYRNESSFPDGYPTVPMAEPEEVSEGDEVGTCGFPLGERLHDELGTVTSSFTKGIVSSIIPGPGIDRRLIRAFQLDLGATGGNSGGPVFIWETGRVFGVIEAGIHHLTKAAALHHVCEQDTLEGLRQAIPGKMPRVSFFSPPTIEEGSV